MYAGTYIVPAWGSLPSDAAYAAKETAFLAAKQVTTASSVALAAAKQVAKAGVFSPLDDYRHAENVNLFWYAPTNVQDAYLKAAYWLAVASRVGNKPTLAAKAAAQLAQANPATASIAMFVSDPQTIIGDAGKTVAAVVGTNKQLKAVAAILGVHATQAEAATSRAMWETSPAGVLIGTGQKTAQDVQAVIEKAASIVTDQKPIWFWPAVIGGGVLFLALVLGIGLRTSPTGIAARAAISRTNRRRRR